MGWVSLSLRKASLQAAISSHTMRDIQISRSIRMLHKELTYEQSVIKRNKANDLRVKKDAYLEVKNSKGEDVEYGTKEYNEWYTQYQEAKTTYDEAKLEIAEYYDDQLAMIEEECSDKEAEYEQEKTTIEAQLEAMRAELEAVDEQISADIESSTIKI